MAQSSWARTTSTRTFDSGAAISSSECVSVFFATSRTRPRNVRWLHAAARTSGEFSPIPAAQTVIGYGQEWTGFRFAVSDDAANEKVRIVECGNVSVGERISELTAFVDGAGSFGRDMTRNSARK